MLVELELWAEVIRESEEATSLEVAVTYRLHKADELVLVSHKLEMASSELGAEEGEWSTVLVEDGTEPDA